MPLRPWSAIPIRDCAESLDSLPEAFFRIEPHPYAAVGAPYGEGATPFRLRRGVIQRLLRAQETLQPSASAIDWRSLMPGARLPCSASSTTPSALV